MKMLFFLGAISWCRAFLHQRVVFEARVTKPVARRSTPLLATLIFWQDSKLLQSCAQVRAMP